MSCLRADRLADYAGGKLSSGATATVEKHVQACARCRTALARVQAAQDVMRESLELPVPDVGGVRTEATIRWLRVRPQPPARPAFVVALGLAACAAGALLLVGREPAKVPIAPPKIAVAPPVRPAAVRLQALITLLGGDVSLDRAGRVTPLQASALVEGGDRMVTAPGARVAAQWGEGSGWLLGPDAELALAELTPLSQKLELERGKIEVRVGARRPGETMQVSAPAHVITVRGTWFTVAADASRTTVEVFEGVVEVTERGGTATTLLRAPATAVFGRGRSSTSPLDPREADARRLRSQLNLLPFAAGLHGALDASALLAVRSEPEGALAVDGVDLGATPLAVRRPLGRHYVELTRAQWKPIRRWVSLGPETGELRLALVRAETIPEPSGPVAVEQMVRERGRQIRACYERSLKRDPTLAGTVSLRLRVGDAGQVTGVRVEDSTLEDPQVADCLRHEAAGWSFKTGRNATVVYPFVFRPQ
ncbi:MAG TPA: AgmX/PglI C-terminal domain-containing protein [Polyangia bacterium]|nr:AgmX/PglI C-terminal domain-containing protein [Polyangia bacterium]